MDKKTLKKYRIGEFAHYLGVTADFLKHYEEHGLLEVEQTESGYRYYSFEQSARVLEYMRLKNYGVGVKEMLELTALDAESAVAALDNKVEELKANIARMQSLVDAHERLHQWYAERKEHPVDWEVRNVEPHYFLRHTKEDEFLADENIYEILRSWSAWMPLTKSAMLIKQPSAGLPKDLYWGLAIPASLLEKHRLPINDAVERMIFNKALVFNFTNLTESFTARKIVAGEHPAFDVLASLKLRPAGDMLLVRELRLGDKTRVHCDVGRFIIPVAQAE